jgi:hypothetical protein
MAKPRRPKPRSKATKQSRVSPVVEESLQAWTKLIAMPVRNELEDIHCRHISDELMPDINRAIRRGIYLSLRNLFLLMEAKHVDDYDRAKAFLWFLLMGIPDYWEDAEMTRDDLAEEDARSEYPILYMPKVQAAFDGWLRQHVYLWVEGQDLHDEPLPFRR